MTLPVEVNPLLASSSSYTIARSLRFRSAATAYLAKTPATAYGSQTWTFSCWVKRGTLGVLQYILSAGIASTGQTSLFFDSSDRLNLYAMDTSILRTSLVTTQVFRDPSAWYHIVAVYDETNATSSERARLYVNGQRITALSTATYSAGGAGTYINSANPHSIGKIGYTTTNYFDGYLAEINSISGTALTPSSFGVTDNNGIWQPKAYTGTYGTNGFYLKFSDNSAATAAAIGKDSSGNGNNWTPNNISVTAGVTYDSMLDSPTVSSTSSNWNVINPLDRNTSSTIAYGNLNLGSASASYKPARSTIGVTSGKWYFEGTIDTLSASNYGVFGIMTASNSLADGAYPGFHSDSYGIAVSGAGYSSYNNGTASSVITTTVLTTDIFQVAVDIDAGKIWFGRNNTWMSGSPSTGTSPSFTFTAGTQYFLSASFYASSGPANFGQRPFTYTPPTGFLALNTYNLPTPTVLSGAQYMAASTYTGTGATQSIVNSGNNPAARSFQPDLVWIKGRNVISNNVLIDSVRGASVLLSSDQTVAESSATSFFSSINSNGFTVTGTSAATNQSAETLIGWQWQAGQGTTTVNTSGTITSNVSVNQSAGFSIVTYTGNGTAGATTGHGLGVTPAMVIYKARSATSPLGNWLVWHKSIGQSSFQTSTTIQLNGFTGTVYLNATNGSSTYGFDPQINGSGSNFVAYCWSEVAGYSKFGSYTGNGAADGPFVYCGFRPRWIMFKTTNIAGNWFIRDTSRDNYNAVTQSLYPNLTDTEFVGGAMDIYSNGFKPRAATSGLNGSGDTHIFAAFAENPFKISRAR